MVRRGLFSWFTWQYTYSSLSRLKHISWCYRIPCSPKRPLQNAVLLRTHRSGSGTLANVIYRYGDLNDLEFALPKQRSYDFYWPLHFNPSFVDKAYLNSTPPNLLVNARYSPDTMTSFMSKVQRLLFIILIYNHLRAFTNLPHSTSCSLTWTRCLSHRSYGLLVTSSLFGAE